ncbi:hypothetical protein JHK87_033921 [Glycine soja]|nr:hypothetical protein JHK87_033921 [Glycine soja]
MEMTNAFSTQNVIGEGGFGCVYKGWLPDGKIVAVKKLKAGSGQGEREFKAEVEIISHVHHRHLVALVGYCICEQQRILIYEYVFFKDHHLHESGMPVLDWAKRLEIAIGAAKGLAYLHEDCSQKIIHRDIKSANILLDNAYEAQVSNFGLARLADAANTYVSTRVMGTFGMEKLDWKANSTQAKSIGTLVSIAGALIITLYKGQAVIKNHPSNKLFPKKHVSSEQFDWVIGAVLLAGHSFAIIGVSLRSIVHIWVMSKKGPLYVAMFKPIGIIFAVIIGIAFLGDSIYLGSVLGTAIVVIGFYAIIWGKSQEQAKEECKVYDDSESYSPIVPLLENKRMEE